MSRRIYITINEDKEKDRIIDEFLSKTYSEREMIKEILYQYATNSTYKVQSAPISTLKVQNENNIKGKNSTSKVQSAPNSTYKVQNEIENNIEIREEDIEIRNNELDQLNEFLNT